MSRPDPDPPLVTAVEFRVSETGAMFALEFVCEDGRLRSVALPAAALPEMLAGIAWTAETVGERPGGASPPDDTLRARLRERAPIAADVTVEGEPGGAAVLLELIIGRTPATVRLSRAQALDLAERLVERLRG